MTHKVEEIYFLGAQGIDKIAYYHRLSKEDQAGLRNICVIDPSPSYEGSSYRADGSDGLRWGVPVKSDFIPKHVQKNGPKREVEDFVRGWGMYLVSQRFRSVVESLEPDVHQFFPVEITWEDGDRVEGEYFFFVVCNSLDTVSVEHSYATRKPGFKYYQQREALGPWKAKEGREEKIVFDLKSVAGHHIWKDKYLSSHGGPFCSGQFKKACEAASIVGVSFGPDGKMDAV